MPVRLYYCTFLIENNKNDEVQLRTNKGKKARGGGTRNYLQMNSDQKSK